VYQGADAADALGEGPGIARVAPAQDDLDTRTMVPALDAWVITPLPSVCASMRR